MKALTLLLLALSFNVNAESAGQDKIEARCGQMAHIAGMQHKVEVHLEIAELVLNDHDITYEKGIAMGYVMAYATLEKMTNKQAALKIYVAICANQSS